MKNMLKEIEKDGLKNIYLFYGEETYIKNFYINQIKSYLLSDDADTMNYNVFEGKEPIDKIIDTALTLPFFSEHRLILLNETNLLMSGRKDDTERFNNFIDDIPNSTVIILNESKIDKRNKLYKKITSLGYVLEIKIPTEKELEKWIENLFRKNNKNIDKDAISYMLSSLSHDMHLLLNETQKLMAYKDNISIDDAKTLCSKSIESKIFELVNHIASKNLDAALDMYDNMLLLKEQPLMILAMMARQFSMMLQVKSLLDSGTSYNEIPSLTGMKSFVVGQCYHQAKNFTKENLICALKDFLETDYKIKTGQLNDELAVKMLIIKYSGV